MTPGLDIARIRAICFDLDGTLVDTDDAYVRRVSRYFQPVRMVFPGIDTNSLARRAVLAGEGPTNKLLGILDSLHLDEALRPLLHGLHYIRGESRGDRIGLIPGVRALLNILFLDYPLAIVTAREKYSADEILSHLDLSTFFQSVIAAGTCRRTKPHPAPIRFAALQMDVPVEACLMVGDTTVDILAGKAAGAQTVGVLCGFGEQKELIRSGANHILKSTADLADLLIPSIRISE